MSSNLDYLDPSLLPLADKVQAYLQAEKDLTQARIAAETPEPAPAAFDQRPATGSYHQHEAEAQQAIENAQDALAALHQEILALLPTRDAWVKVNLGYGPSRVGAFRNEQFGSDPNAPEYVLRVVQ